jgi:hypothetical protein
MFVHRDIFNCLRDNKLDEFGRDGSGWVATREKIEIYYDDYRSLLNKEEDSSKEIYIRQSPLFLHIKKMETLERMYREVIEAGKLKDEMVDFLLFNGSLSYANIHYFPAVNGYQCGSPYASRDLHKKIVDILNKEIEELKKNDY